MKFTSVLLSLFSIRYMLIPFSLQRTVFYIAADEFIGYTNYRIFGILVAKIQETKPWGK